MGIRDGDTSSPCRIPKGIGGRVGRRPPAPLVRRGSVGGFVPSRDTLLQPGEHFLLDPSDPTARAVPETKSAGKRSGMLEPLDVLGAVQDELLELTLGQNPHRGISRVGSIARCPGG